MAFRDIIADALHAGSLSKDQYLQSYKARQHISISKMEEHDEISYIGIGEKIACKYASPIDKRYIGFKDVSYDLILSLYEINSKSALAARIYKDAKWAGKPIDDYMHQLRGIKKPSVEARLIGMQNSQDTSLLDNVLSMLAARKIEVYEADLFGANIRHIALDLHTGTTFDVLVYDRIYKPGELINKLTEEQFSRSYVPGSPAEQSGMGAAAHG